MVTEEVNKPKNKTQKVVQKSLKPIQEFMNMEASGGIVLVAMAVIAMVWANSPFREAYEHFFHLPISLTIGGVLHLEHSLLHWINDGLMVIFFFVVGLEIKREMVIGELSTVRKATLPILGAIGGMIVPALIYYFFNTEGAGVSGWGIPMATDIAFAVGIITLLGKRVPFALKVFLLALAIVDDLGAIMVIAVFYTESISLSALGTAGAIIVLCLFLNRAGVRNLLVYIVAGIFIWLFFLKSGVHATIAGVILGLITPVHAWIDRNYFFSEVDKLAKRAAESMRSIMGNGDKPSAVPQEALHELESLQFLTKESVSPLDRIVHALHPWVTFFIMPVFALGNAGVYLGTIDFGEVLHNSITIGVFAGLLIGKPLGIFIFCFLGTKLKICSLPTGIGWPHIKGVGFLAGIGFTMALFISNLALTPETLDYSKIGILSASFVAAVIGFMMLYKAKPKT